MTHRLTPAAGARAGCSSTLRSTWRRAGTVRRGLCSSGFNRRPLIQNWSVNLQNAVGESEIRGIRGERDKEDCLPRERTLIAGKWALETFSSKHCGCVGRAGSWQTKRELCRGWGQPSGGESFADGWTHSQVFHERTAQPCFSRGKVPLGRAPWPRNLPTSRHCQLRCHYARVRFHRFKILNS